MVRAGNMPGLEASHCNSPVRFVVVFVLFRCNE